MNTFKIIQDMNTNVVIMDVSDDFDKSLIAAFKDLKIAKKFLSLLDQKFKSKSKKYMISLLTKPPKQQKNIFVEAGWEI